jgi:phosphohistidine phosphatase
MKKLLLLRHAKSSRDDPGLRDFDRPLNDRGKQDAKLIGRLLRQKKLAVDCVVGSPAKRARQTAEHVLEAAGLPNEILFDERIYEANVHQLLGVLSEIGATHDVALMVGHNPGFEDLVTCLTDRAAHMGTASLACVELNLQSWRDIAPRTGQLLWFVTPPELKN